MKTRRLVTASFALIIDLLLVTGLVAPTTLAATSSGELADGQPVSTSAPALQYSRSSSQESDAAGYWTEEKMRTAIPAEELAPEPNQDDRPQAVESDETIVGEDLSHPIYPQSPPERQVRNEVVPATAGKVFFTYKGRNYVCSGSVINGPTKNVVSTAAHCIHGGKGERWHANIAFAPAYHNGLSRYGLWNWKTLHTFQGWINSSNSFYDQAFFTVHPRKGRTLVDTVGGNGLSYNYGHRQTGVRIWGWPAEPPYDGNKPYYCDGATRKWNWRSRDMVMPCSMTGGASGGPWLRSRIDTNLGYVFGVTSRQTTSGQKLLISTPFNGAVNDLFRSIK